MEKKQPKTISLSKAYEIATTGEEALTGDLRNEMGKGFLSEIQKCIAKTSWKEPYYIIAIMKKNDMIRNMLRTVFFARRTEPQKDFDTCCYRYIPALEKLEFLWAIPSKAGVDHYAELQGNISKEEEDMRDRCRSFLKERKLVKVILPS